MVGSEIKELNGLKREFNQLYFDSRVINTPAVYDGHIAYGEKLGQVKGHRDQQISLMAKVKDIDKRIGEILVSITQFRNEVEDLSLGLVNSFQTEYDCSMFYRGWAYYAKFVKNSEHWSVENAEKSWEKDYNDCVEYFKVLTKGLDTHNFTIITYEDGSNAIFKFTVSGVPGDFEIIMPLNSREQFIQNSRLDSFKSMMSMGLTWRRAYVIPHFDYFFESFGAYTAEEVNAKLHEFISSKKYEEFCNTKTYVKERFDLEQCRVIKETMHYDEATSEILERQLQREIEANGKEGKYTN